MCNHSGGGANGPWRIAVTVAVGCALILGLSGASVGIWSEPMAMELPISDRDTRVHVREMALDEFRLKAARKVGSIVEASMQTDGQRLSEEIRTVGVSLVRLEDVSEKVRTDKAGNVYLLVSARVEVDESELSRRAEAMRQDVSKLDRIRRLGDQNEVLRQTITKLSKALAEAGSAKEAASLLSQHAQTMERVKLVNEGVGHTFRAGALVDVAAESELQWAGVRTSLDQWIFSAIMHAPVTLKLQSVEKSASGYTALVRVGWTPDFKEVERSASQYLPDLFLWDKTGSPYLRLTSSSFRRYEKSEWTRKYFEELARTRVDLELAVGGGRTRLPVLFQADGRLFSLPCGLRVQEPDVQDWVTVCLVSQKESNPALKGVGIGSGRNPVAIDLTAGQAADATMLDARWILTRSDGSQEARAAVVMQ